MFREADRADSIFLLDSGLVKLSRHIDSNHKTIVRLVRPGQLIGDRALSGVNQQRYTAHALADSTVWEIGRDQFRQTCDESTAVLAWITEQVEARLDEVQRRVELIAYARVEARILALLAELAEGVLESMPDLHAVAIPLSQSEIAQLIGATRETASTTLNQLARRNLVRLGRRQIEVVSLDAVREASLFREQRAASAHA